MKTFALYPSQKKHKDHGFGLVELMIAIAISLVVVLAITTLFLTQKRTYAAQDDLSRLQENARFMVQDISIALRQAGYRDVLATTNFGASDVILAATSGSNTAGASGVDASDSFTVRFFGASKASDATQADGSIIDCNGTAVTRDTMVVETFSIQNVSGIPSLVCLVAPATVPTLMYPNVDSMQVLYGYDMNQDGAVDLFKPAISGADMTLVRSMVVSFVMRTPSINNPSPATNIFNHFGIKYAPLNVAPTNDLGSVYTAPSDNRVRRQFSFSIGLRNRLD